MRHPLTTAALFVSLTGAAFAQDTQSFDRIERGRYLAVLGDCAGVSYRAGRAAVRRWPGAADAVWHAGRAEHHA